MIDLFFPPAPRNKVQQGSSYRSLSKDKLTDEFSLNPALLLLNNNMYMLIDASQSILIAPTNT